MSSPSTPSPSSGPPPAEASSATSEKASSAADGGLIDAGPAFDPGAPPPPRDTPITLPKGQAAPKAGDIEATLRSVLAAKGEIMHGLLAVGPKLGVDSNEWRYLDAELDAIAEPLARILSRIPAAATAVAAGGDPIAVGLGFIGYGTRSIAERQAVVAIARQAHDQAHGVAVAPEVVPDVAAAATDDDERPPVPPINGPRGR